MRFDEIFHSHSGQGVKSRRDGAAEGDNIYCTKQNYKSVKYMKKQCKVKIIIRPLKDNKSKTFCCNGIDVNNSIRFPIIKLIMFTI